MLDSKEAGSLEPGPSAHHEADQRNTDSSPEVSAMYNGGIPEANNATGLLSAALWYARMGFRIHPLWPGTKNHPRWSEWQHRATTDANGVRDHWRWHKADNVAVATGHGVVVIDLDTRAVDGIASFQAWLNEHPDVHLPVAPVVRTPSGGAHLWFRTSCEVRTCAGWRPGVDVRGEGGYVVVPPSAVRLMMDDGTHGRKEAVWLDYRLERGRLDQLPVAPDALLAAINAEGGSSTRAAGSGGSRGNAAGDLKRLEYYLSHGFTPGSRDAECYRLACSLYRKHWDDPQWVEAILADVWRATAQPEGNPFGWSEVVHKMRGARAFIAEEREKEAKALAFLRRGGAS